MNKKELKIYAIVLIIIVFLLGILIGILFTSSNYDNKYECKYDKNICHDIIGMITPSVENHEYIRNVYDCTEFSKATVDILNISGYEAYVVRGLRNGTLHNWVQMIINIDYANIVEPRDYKNYEFIEREIWMENV